MFAIGKEIIVRRTMAKRPKTRDGYAELLTELRGMLESARRASARSVNTIMTATYWHIGRRIVESEQGGRKKADYGQVLIKRLGSDLSKRFGRGFGWRNLFQMRSFFLAWPEILQTPSAICEGRTRARKLQTAPAKFIAADPIAARFPLPWSAYVRLLAVKDLAARRFYEAEAMRAGWSTRQLDRQICSMFYERIALSRNKVKMLKKARSGRPEDRVTPEEEIKEPYILEFLNLKDEYSESELESGLIRRLEEFLLELGDDFAFIGRQRRLRIDNEWYRVDLVFFHRRLRCLVIVDLKAGKLTHADAGQMHLYLNYAREHWMREGENPPVGLILCATKTEAVARYSLDGLANKVMAAEYRTVLPDAKRIEAELTKVRNTLEARRVN